VTDLRCEPVWRGLPWSARLRAVPASTSISTIVPAQTEHVATALTAIRKKATAFQLYRWAAVCPISCAPKTLKPGHSVRPLDLFCHVPVPQTLAKRAVEHAAKTCVGRSATRGLYVISAQLKAALAARTIASTRSAVPMPHVYPTASNFAAPTKVAKRDTSIKMVT